VNLHGACHWYAPDRKEKRRAKGAPLLCLGSAWG
jgi:hypothetical protein